LGLGDTDNPNSSTTVLFWILAFVFIIGGRIGARALARRANVYLQPAIVIGTGEIGQLIGRKLLRHSEYGITLVGFIDEKSKEPESSLHELPIPGRDGHHLPILGAPDVHDVPVLGGLDSLERVVGQFRVARAIVAPSIDHDSHLLEPVRTLRALGVHVDIVPRLFEVVGLTHDVHSVEGISLLGLSPIARSRFSELMKRAIDLSGAIIGLAVTAPFFAVVAVLIKANSPGPVFFRQTRLGKDMRSFALLKFRTMKIDTDERVHEEFIAATMRSQDAPSDDGLYKLSRDDDVTEIGRWLRRTSLDELPQLINVLRGDMSLVGPRPCIPYEVKDFKPHHFDRFLVPAGMTGFWQTSARAHASYAEALDMDALYAQSWSLGLDFLLLARTPPQLLAAKATR
jgi:exopolysaccharide biosynthesis polyprenyl glycosylphosphotransferase